MGPKITLVCHLHIKLGHTNNKYGENIKDELEEEHGREFDLK